MSSTPQGAGELSGLLEDVRRKLVETGTRNRLIHINRANRRAKVLHIENERSQDVFELLRLQGKNMKFKAMGSDEPQEEDPDEPHFEAEEEEEFDEARYRDTFLETPLGPDALHKRLLGLANDAKTFEEEQGVSILYLALGFLSWYEDPKSEVVRESPLILLPVALERSKRGASFTLATRADDIVTNLPLQERLLDNFGVALPDIDDSADWKPEDYFDSVAEAIEEQTRWRIDRDGILLGFFSFSKLLMLRDLEPGNWPNMDLANHPLMSGLLKGGFGTEAPLFGPKEPLDERLAPKDIIQVVDADASQTKIIQEVRAGRNLVVQGPPGTGKSQTITNIIAAAVHDKKTVLFMAEKMAALEVVHRRLKQVGLGDICLELHSRYANKKAVLEEFRRTLAPKEIPAEPPAPEQLQELRDQLNGIADLLHDPLADLDYSPFSAMTEMASLIGNGISPPDWRAENLGDLSREGRNALEDAIRTLVQLGPRRSQPFYGVGNLSLQPPDLQRIRGEIENTTAHIQKALDAGSSCAKRIGVTDPTSLQEISTLEDILALAERIPDGLTEILELFLARTDPDLVEALQAGHNWRQAREEAEELYTDVAWELPMAELHRLRGPIAMGASSFLQRIFGGYRSASHEFGTLLKRPLPPEPTARLSMIDRLLDIQRKRASLKQDEVVLQSGLGQHWRGERTDFRGLLLCGRWVQEALDWLPNAEAVRSLSKLAAEAEALRGELQQCRGETTPGCARLLEQLQLGLGEGIGLDSCDLADLQGRLARIGKGLDSYVDWVRLSRAATDLQEAGLGQLVEALDMRPATADVKDTEAGEGTLQPEAEAADPEEGDAPAQEDPALWEFRYAVAEARWDHALRQRPALGELPQRDRHGLVETFQDMERGRMEEARTLIRARHLRQLPSMGVGEIGVIRGEIGKKTRHMPIRKLLRSAPKAAQRVKPVFLMSPISIAQFLKPGVMEFDLLVIDEASQVRPEDALGAIVRAKQIVVVGDRQQLPPTSFFDRLTAPPEEEEDEDDEESAPQGARAIEMESILTLCEVRGLNQSMLEWHYRSRDPSLIRVSSNEFYDDRLILPPSPLELDEQYGLKFTRVPGVYASGSAARRGTNRIEAEHIAAAVARHARECPTLSLGIVAFSTSQRDMINEVLEFSRRSDAALDTFLGGSKTEDVFVKNIENVQGDERDVILISVGYGPHEANGRLASMRFGPVNSEGGERRLNVLFTRARYRCEIFASFDPGDIDLSRTRADRRGLKVLKRFLEFAKTGNLDLAHPTGEEADSLFEEDVARVIRGLGYPADHQVGSAGFRIDLGVRNPKRLGQYILAVECDGANWHNSLWARERDRLRQDVLEGLGWRFHRIWSTDWFYNRQHEIERLRAALEEAASVDALSVEGVNVQVEASEEEPMPPEPEDSSPPEAAEATPALKTVPYRRAQPIFMRTPGRELHEERVHILEGPVTQTVQLEGPIHQDEVARRIATAAGMAQAGKRIRARVLQVLQGKRQEGALMELDGFWMTPAQQESPPIRDRSEEEGTVTKAEYIPPLEIQALAQVIREESGAIDNDELAGEVARQLGFRRVGANLRGAILSALE